MSEETQNPDNNTTEDTKKIPEQSPAEPDKTPEQSPSEPDKTPVQGPAEPDKTPVQGPAEPDKTPVQSPAEPLQPVAPPAEKKPTDIIEKPITRSPETISQVPSAMADNEAMERRTFIKWLTIGWSAFAAVVAGYGVFILRFLFPNVLFEPKQSFLAGFPDEYEPGSVSERFKGKHGVWIVRDSEKIFALSTVCTHLGCTPNWLENDKKFKCPCHGSGFYKTGINFEGPAPRPLERFRIVLNDEGEILIDKTKKYQQEKGEWDDPGSYLFA